MSRVSLSISSIWLVNVLSCSARPAPFQQTQLDLASKRGEWRTELVRKGGAELPHLADSRFEPHERVIECRRDFVELIAAAANRKASVQRADPDAPRVCGQLRQRRQRGAGGPPDRDGDNHQTRQDDPQQQLDVAVKCVVHLFHRRPHLKEVALARGLRDDAVRESKATVGGVDIVGPRPAEERTHLAWSEIQPERVEAVRLREQLPAVRVVDLVVPRGLVNERRPDRCRFRRSRSSARRLSNRR